MEDERSGLSGVPALLVWKSFRFRMTDVPRGTVELPLWNGALTGDVPRGTFALVPHEDLQNAIIGFGDWKFPTMHEALHGKL